MVYDPWTDIKFEVAVVDDIIKDLNGRSGFDLGALDEEIRDEIRNTWIELVRCSLRANRNFGK
jgi:hypothetical protein